MFEVKNFNCWLEYDGNSEGSGRSEKEWLTNKGTIGLFKFPKTSDTTEHISEKLASEIGKVIGIKCADIDLGIYKNRLGSMSYNVKNDKQDLKEALAFLSSSYPNYNKDTLIDSESNTYYCLDMLIPIIEKTGFYKDFFEMLVFDALIGNTDRHHSNWAIIQDISGKQHYCPLYDNGSSLCCYVKEKDINSYLGKDKRRFNSLIDTKSKSRIRIDGSSRKEPKHSEMLEYLLDKSEYRKYCIPHTKNKSAININNNF